MELMEFLAAKMPDASRTKLKALLSKRVVYVDSVITTQYNFPLKPGMKVQISREKGRKEFNNKLLKIVYEDAYLIVVEKMQGLLSVNTESAVSVAGGINNRPELRLFEAQTEQLSVQEATNRTFFLQ